MSNSEKIKDACDVFMALGRDGVLDMLDNAQAVPAEPAQTWRDALKKSMVGPDELRSMALEPRQQLLGDWLCEGDLGFIYAPRGVGKTWLALLIARAVSEGGSVGGCWKAPAAAKVLYVDGEMPPDLIRERDMGIERGRGNILFLNHEILFERSGEVINITKPEIQKALIDECEEAGIKLLVLDNLSTLASGMKENDADAWEMVNNWLLDFRRRRIAVILVHHAGRNGEMRGTSKREDAAFWVIALEDAKRHTDDKSGARFKSRFTKPSRNTPDEIPPCEWCIRTDHNSGEVHVTQAPARSGDQFRRLITEGVVDCGQLADELGVSPATVSRMAHKAIREGWLKKKGKEYALTEEPGE